MTVHRTLTLCLVLVSTACGGAFGGKAKEEDPGTRGNAVVEATQAAFMKIDFVVAANEVAYRISPVPAGAAMECQVDRDVPFACEKDGKLGALPGGSHVLSVTARKDSNVVGTGDRRFTVGGVSSQSSVITSRELDVVLDKSFEFGQALPLSSDAEFSFHLTGSPQCKPAFRCSYDIDPAHPVWGDCSTSNKMIISKSIMAAGFQRLTIQATCGDQSGAPLQLGWFGVPDNYKKLMAQEVRDNQGNRAYPLVKANDCSRDRLVYECANPGSLTFAICSAGTRIASPAEGTRIRATCGTQIGPEFSVAAD